MSRDITTQQILARNRNHPGAQWAIIHGGVYRVHLIPFKECKINKSFQAQDLQSSIPTSSMRYFAKKWPSPRAKV